MWSRDFSKCKKHSNYSQYLLEIRVDQCQLVIHNMACGQLKSSQICPVSKDSGDAGWEPVDHMAKPCPARQKKFLILYQLTALLPKNVNCAVIMPCHRFTQRIIHTSTDFGMYSIKTNKQKRSEPESMSRETVCGAPQQIINKLHCYS